MTDKPTSPFASLAGQRARRVQQPCPSCGVSRGPLLYRPNGATIELVCPLCYMLGESLNAQQVSASPPAQDET